MSRLMTPAEPRRPPSSRGITTVGVLLAGGLLASCCIGGVVIGERFLGPAHGNRKSSDLTVADKDVIPDTKDDVEPQPKDGAIEPPPKIVWPVVVKFDDRGVFSMAATLEPGDAGATTSRHFRFRAQANVAYVVEAVDQPDIHVHVESADGASIIEPKEKSGPHHQLAFIPNADRDYVAVATGDPLKVTDSFTVRIRAWDENEPLPPHLQFPAPQAELPKIEPAQAIAKQMLVGGAFAPNNKSFWLSSHDMTLTLWDHPAIAKKGGFKLNKRLYALAVDGKGRLYAQSGPADTRPPTFAQRTRGNIEVYDDLDPKGDADDLPPPSRTFLVDGLIGRMITSPDRRAVYFLDVHHQALGRIDTEDGKIDKTLSGLSAGTRAFCVAPDGRKIYCCADSGHIDVIDALAFKLETSIPLTRGRPYAIAATNKGIVFVLMPEMIEGKPSRGVCAIVDLSRPVADKAGVVPVPCSHHGQFLQIIPDREAVLVSGDRKVSVCIAPPRPALQKALCQEYAVREALAPGWMQLSPDGKTLLHDAGEILSIR